MSEVEKNGEIDADALVASDVNRLTKTQLQIELERKEQELRELRQERDKLVSEVEKLTKAAVEGKLDIRGDVSKFKGGYAKIVQGINDTLDAVVEPVREVMRVCNALAKGNLSERIEIEAKGEFLELTESLNTAVGNMSDLLTELQDAVQNVASVANESAASIEQVNSGMQQIASASQQIAKGAQQISSTVNESAKEIKETNAVLQQVQSHAEESNKFAVESAESAKEMSEVAEKSAEGMKEIQEAIGNAVEVMKSLGDSICNCVLVSRFTSLATSASASISPFFSTSDIFHPPLICFYPSRQRQTVQRGHRVCAVRSLD